MKRSRNQTKASVASSGRMSFRQMLSVCVDAEPDNSGAIKIWAVLVGPILALVGAILLWGSSLPKIDPNHMNDLGLVSVLPLSAYITMIILTASFCLSVHQPQVPKPILLFHVLVLIIFLHGTPPIVYGNLRYSWAWKHVGIIDYIQRHLCVNPDISTMSAYHNWPGFFTLSTFIVEITGIENPLTIATWAPVFFNFLYLGVLLLIYQTFTSDRRLVWLSIWFFYLTNWVGQDYFSPQALNYFLHLAILGICLKWFSLQALPLESNPENRYMFGPNLPRFQRLISGNARNDIPADNVQAFQRSGMMAVVILLFAAVASSHQLTPFMTISSITALVIFRRSFSIGLPVLMLVITASWIIYGARSFFGNEFASLIASLGQVTDNLDKNLIDLSQATPGQRLVAIMGRALSVFLWGMALLGCARRLRSGYRDLPGILLTFAPFVLLIGTGYGGEIIFRIYLFTLPFMSFFAAALIYPCRTLGATRHTVALTILLCSLLSFGFGFAHYGKDRQYHFSKSEVQVATYLYSTAPPGSLLIEGSRNYPTQFRNYEFFTYVPIDREPRMSQLKIIEDPVKVLTRWMSNKSYTRTYLLITRSQKANIDALGTMPVGSLDLIENALLVSPKFEVIYGNDDAKIFILADVDKGVVQ